MEILVLELELHASNFLLIPRTDPSRDEGPDVFPRLMPHNMGDSGPSPRLIVSQNNGARALSYYQ